MSRMYQLCFVGIAMMALLVPMQKSHAVLIDFEDGVSNLATITTEYSGLGLTFDNAAWITFGGFIDGSFGLGTDLGASGNAWAFPGTSNPIIIDFDTPLSTVSIDAFDVLELGVKLEAFNSSFVSLGEDIFTTATTANTTLSLTVNGITRIELSQLSDQDKQLCFH
jgi:hypothetical protein